MCGRFAVTTDPARLAAELDAVDETGGPDRAPNYNAPNYAAPNYNVAPSTDIAAVVTRHDDDDPADRATRRLRLMRWGLLPPWATPDKPARPLINARAETLTTSPAFRAAARKRRCLVPMDGYYEWKPGEHPRRGKTPFYFYRTDGAPLLVAGLWAASADGLNCTVITTDAPVGFADVHDRMPLVLAAPDWDRWLDPDAPAPEDLLNAPPDVSAMAMREVSRLVNSVANNGPELIDPVEGPIVSTQGGDQPVGLF